MNNEMIEDAEVVEPAPAPLPELDVHIALHNLSVAAKAALLNYQQHQMCEQSFNCLAKAINFKTPESVKSH